ncbi:MAG: hypothetical protein B7Y80_01525 [Hyphomicrobium sp. 32-62-53]|nr:MAG: hypothetical protein B7Z29_01875 [Hyphomicrobium sp. 12-62-95]OYY01434.1 MAG: hypothetical protein B7Y80_01525 [Hyphomicrobium sp. 32-62-53]
MAKETKKQSRNAVKIEAAKAKAATANAEAAKAQAEAAQINATLEKARLDDDRARRELEASQRAEKQKFDSAVSAATYAAGFAGGKVISSGIDKSIEKSAAVKNKALQDLASETKKIVDKAGGDSAAGKRATAKLEATVKTADKVGLTKVGSKMPGMVTGVGLIATGVATRMMGSSQEDPTLKTIYTSLGTAEIVAGGTVIYSQLKSAAAPKVLPDVKSLAQIEQARAIAAPGTPEAPAKQPKAVAPAAPKARAASPPGAKKAKAASKALVSGMTESGKANAAKAAGKTVAKGALRALGPVAVVAAAVTAVAGSAQAGESTAQNIARGAVAAADAATFGVAGLVAETVRNKETIKVDHRENARQANLAAAEKKLAAGGKLTRAEEMAISEEAAEPSTADGAFERAADIMTGAGGAMAGVAMLKQAADTIARPGFVGRTLLRTGGVGMVAVGGVMVYDAVTRPAGGKAYLNDAAKRKAAEVPAIDPAIAGAMMASAAMRPDGQTEGYQRKSKNGLIVNVQGYRTPGQ